MSLNAGRVFQVRFTPRFLLMDRSSKVFLTLLTILWGGKYPVVVLLLQFNVHSILWHQADWQLPCSIVWINALRSFVFSTSAVGSLAGAACPA